MLLSKKLMWKIHQLDDIVHVAAFVLLRQRQSTLGTLISAWLGRFFLGPQFRFAERGFTALRIASVAFKRFLLSGCIKLVN